MNEVTQTIETYNKIALSYCKKTRLKKYLDWEEQYIKKLMSYNNSIMPNILDVGCGDGRHCLLIDKNGGQSVGIDLSPSMITEATEYYPDGDFRIMNMINLEFNKSSFDGIWSSGSIYHVTKNDVNKVLNEFHRVLRKNGVLGLSYKLGGGEGLETNPKSYAGAPRYFAYYSKNEMDGLLAASGFDELHACTYPEEIFGDNIIQVWLRKV
ncbi:MAG: class I SAM-dependent methyltransferase [candidate division Zixibacteria bacterium]|nr:class I SAM-dependent methyltransferase [candidate division Zixibacteria bacterium]